MASPILVRARNTSAGVNGSQGISTVLGLFVSSSVTLMFLSGSETFIRCFWGLWSIRVVPFRSLYVGIFFLPLIPKYVRQGLVMRSRWCSNVRLNRSLQPSHSSSEISVLLPRDSGTAWASCLNVVPEASRKQYRHFLGWVLPI